MKKKTSLFCLKPVCVRARHEAGIPAALTLLEPQSGSTSGDREDVQTLPLLLLSHESEPAGPPRLLINHRGLSSLQTSIYLCTEVTFIHTSDPE